LPRAESSRYQRKVFTRNSRHQYAFCAIESTPQVGELLIVVPFLQDLYGVAEPAIPGDELDITTTPSVDDVVNIAEVSHASSTKAKIPGLAAATGSADGLSMGQKLFFIVAIVAVCVLFLKSRNGGQSNIIGGLKEKSMA
jgi:hypothetical protein